MQRARLIFPGEPIAKGRPRARRANWGIQTYTPPKTRKAEQNLAKLAQDQWQGPPWNGPIVLRVVAYFGIRKNWTKTRQMAEVGQPHVQKPDSDNVLKLVEDALNGIAFDDDQQVFDTRATKFWAPQPRIEVTLHRWIG